MAKGLYLVLIVTGCFAYIHATTLLNDKDATSFFRVHRVKRSSSCVVDESFCELNYATCSTGSGREAIRENKCNGVGCPFGEKCDIQTTSSVCPRHIAGTTCVNDEITLRATLIVAVFGFGLIVIMMIVITVLKVYRCKRKGKLFPQQGPEANENKQESERHIPAA